MSTRPTHDETDATCECIACEIESELASFDFRLAMVERAISNIVCHMNNAAIVRSVAEEAALREAGRRARARWGLPPIKENEPS